MASENVLMIFFRIKNEGWYYMGGGPFVYFNWGSILNKPEKL